MDSGKSTAVETPVSADDVDDYFILDDSQNFKSLCGVKLNEGVS